MKTTIEAELSQEETDFVNDPLAYLGKDPQSFPVSDGSAVTISAFAAHIMRETFGIDRVKAVTANGAKYLYLPFKIPANLSVMAVYTGKVGPLVTWPFGEFVARHVYRLHHYLPGDGRIVHNGTPSFLPADYTREQRPENNREPATPVGARSKDYLPKVGADIIQQQLSWFAEPALRTEAVKWAARLTNPAVAQDIVQATYLKLYRQISGGQCEATEPKQLHDYVLTAVQFKCRTAAKNGKLNGDVMPDLLARKGITVGTPETENLWHDMREMERAVCGPTYKD